MEQVFGYFDYVEFEIYDGFLRIRYDKPRIQGLQEGQELHPIHRWQSGQ